MSAILDGQRRDWDNYERDLLWGIAHGIEAELQDEGSVAQPDLIMKAFGRAEKIIEGRNRCFYKNTAGSIYWAMRDAFQVDDPVALQEAIDFYRMELATIAGVLTSIAECSQDLRLPFSIVESKRLRSLTGWFIAGLVVLPGVMKPSEIILDVLSPHAVWSSNYASHALTAFELDVHFLFITARRFGKFDSVNIRIENVHKDLQEAVAVAIEKATHEKLLECRSVSIAFPGDFGRRVLKALFGRRKGGGAYTITIRHSLLAQDIEVLRAALTRRNCSGVLTLSLTLARSSLFVSERFRKLVSSKWCYSSTVIITFRRSLNDGQQISFAPDEEDAFIDAMVAGDNIHSLQVSSISPEFQMRIARVCHFKSVLVDAAKVVRTASHYHQCRDWCLTVWRIGFRHLKSNFSGPYFTRAEAFVSYWTMSSTAIHRDVAALMEHDRQSGSKIAKALTIVRELSIAYKLFTSSLPVLIQDFVDVAGIIEYTLWHPRSVMSWYHNDNLPTLKSMPKVKRIAAFKTHPRKSKRLRSSNSQS